ncbi:hypothetical protein ACA910_009568 [Epithemia clementina (nom. ined.)]
MKYSYSNDDSEIELKSIPESSITRDPSWLHDMIRQRMPFKLQMFSREVIFADIVAELLNNEWKEPLFDFLDISKNLLKEACELAVEQASLSRFPVLEARMKKLTLSVIDQIVQDTHASIENKVNNNPYSQHKDLFQQIVWHCTKDIESSIEAALSLKGKEDTESIEVFKIKSALRTVFTPCREKSVIDIIASDLQNALVAYVKIAVVCFADEIPMLCKSIFETLEEKLRERIFEVLDDDVKLENLLKVPEKVQQQLRETTTKVQTLDQALEMIQELNLTVPESFY